MRCSALNVLLVAASLAPAVWAFGWKVKFSLVSKDGESLRQPSVKFKKEVQTLKLPESWAEFEGDEEIKVEVMANLLGYKKEDEVWEVEFGDRNGRDLQTAAKAVRNGQTIPWHKEFGSISVLLRS